MGLFNAVRFTYGKYSTDEVMAPRLRVMEDEFVSSLQRLARGVEVNAESLDWDTLVEGVRTGRFLDLPATVARFREELWQPTLRSGEAWEAWLAGGSVTWVEKARAKVIGMLDPYHPRGITDATFERLLVLLDRFARDLHLDGYRRPALP